MKIIIIVQEINGQPDLPPMDTREEGEFQLHYDFDPITGRPRAGGWQRRADIAPGAVEVDGPPETIAYMREHPERWKEIWT